MDGEQDICPPRFKCLIALWAVVFFVRKGDNATYQCRYDYYSYGDGNYPPFNLFRFAKPIYLAGREGEGKKGDEQYADDDPFHFFSLYQ